MENLLLLHVNYSETFPLSSGCKNSMNHAGEGLNHEAKHRCRYSVQYDNRVYTCKVRPRGFVCVLVSSSHVG